MVRTERKNRVAVRFIGGSDRMRRGPGAGFPQMDGSHTDHGAMGPADRNEP